MQPNHSRENEEHSRASIRQWLTPMYAMASFTIIAIIAAGLWGILLQQTKASWQPSLALQHAAASVPSGQLAVWAERALPSTEAADEQQNWSVAYGLGFLIRYMTQIDWHDPRTLLARQIPGLMPPTAVILSGHSSDRPFDVTPPADLLQPTVIPQLPQRAPGPVWLPDEMKDLERNIGVLIYHSHNRESWIPELDGVTEPERAFDSDINITMVGGYLARRLHQLGIGVTVDKEDYPSAVPSFQYSRSYDYSRGVVEAALTEHEDLLFIFDLHRDAQERDRTTLEVDGKAYAIVYFIVGQRNLDWRENAAFSQQLHERLNERFPGISKGVFGKTASQGNAEYNQSLLLTSTLIEIGGPYNTLEESYRTADILAEVIAEMYFDARMVDSLIDQEGVAR